MTEILFRWNIAWFSRHVFFLKTNNYEIERRSSIGEERKETIR
jgi:hypothetical protein